MKRALLLILLAAPGIATPQINGLPDAVRTDRAIDRSTSPPAAPANAAPDPAQRTDKNKQAVARCLTDRGLPSELCRQRRPDPDVPMSRAQAEKLEQRYESEPAPPGARAVEDATGRTPGAGP